MRKQWLLTAASLLTAAFTMVTASAETVTVEVSGTVDYVDDYNNTLGGAIWHGQSVSGTYTYDTSVPDQDGSPEYGHYLQDPAVLSIQVDVGGTTFESNVQPTSTAFATVDVANTAWHDGFFVGSSGNHKSLSNGASVDHIDFHFSDPTATALTSDAIISTAPPLQNFEEASIHIGGQSSSGAWYNVGITITAVSSASEVVPDGTFDLNAEIVNVYDPAGALGQAIQVGSTIDGTYRINPDLPDSDPHQEWGVYEHPLGGDYGFSLEVDGLQFTSDPTRRAVTAAVVDSYHDEFHLLSEGQPVQTAAGTLKVYHIDMWLTANGNEVWSSDALSSDAPPLDGFDMYRDLYIGGVDGAGNHWSFVARVLDISKANAEPSVPRIVSPASGFFFREQRVRVAFILPRGKQFSHITGTTNGKPIREFVEHCYPMAQLMDDREAVVCSDLNSLPPGKNNVNWTIHYQDGSSDTESVEWELLD